MQTKRVLALLVLLAGCGSTDPKIAIYRDPKTGAEFTCKGAGFASSGSVTEYAQNDSEYNTCKDRMESQGYERVKK